MKRGSCQELYCHHLFVHTICKMMVLRHASICSKISIAVQPSLALCQGCHWCRCICSPLLGDFSVGYNMCRGAMLLDLMQSWLASQPCLASCCHMDLTWRQRALRCASNHLGYSTFEIQLAQQNWMTECDTQSVQGRRLSGYPSITCQDLVNCQGMSQIVLSLGRTAIYVLVVRVYDLRLQKDSCDVLFNFEMHHRERQLSTLQ